MQRIVVFKPPYGSTFNFAPGPLHGGPHNVWLIYDSISDHDVLQWMRDTLSAHEDYLRAIAQSVPPTAPLPPVLEVSTPAKSVLDKISNMATQGGHEWGSAYKFGLICRRCGQSANGLETRCAVSPASPPPDWRPEVGKRVIDKRTGHSYLVEGGENGRWLLADGPVLLTEQLSPDTTTPDDDS